MDGWMDGWSLPLFDFWTAGSISMQHVSLNDVKTNILTPYWIGQGNRQPCQAPLTRRNKSTVEKF